MPNQMEFIFDPFVDSIVKDPRRVVYSVFGLNEHVVETVRHEIDALVQPERPRYQVHPPTTLFIASPRAGFGKSHLIGNLFKTFSGKVTLVSVLPFLDPDTCWKSLLTRVVQELMFPDRSANHDAPLQMELFVHGVLSQIVADQLKVSNDTPSELMRGPVEELARSTLWITYLQDRFKNKQWVAEVELRLLKNGLNLNTRLSTWLKILVGYTRKDDYDLMRACTDWMQGDSVDEEIIAPLRIPPANLLRHDLAAAEINAIAKKRLLDLCQLAGFYRPFLFCFDQTETYGNHANLAHALGMVITDLTDEACNQLTLMTANIDPWEARLRPNWEQAHRDRLALPPLMLEGISKDQGIELAEHRLNSSEKDTLTKQVFWGDKQWLNELFRDTHTMGAREFLGHCSRRWQKMMEEPETPPTVSLDSVFQEYIDKVSAKPRRTEFDRDTFYWLVTELAQGLQGVVIDKVKSQNSDNIPRWQCNGNTFVFGFEAGSHWKRWQTIARSALANDVQNGHRILVCPRTPELPTIPRPTWIVASDEILKAMQSHLLVLQLNSHQLIRLYAAQDIYSDAVQGDIAWKPEDVASFLQEALTDFWQSILNWQGTHLEPNPEPKPEPTILKNLVQTITHIVSKKKFLSLDDLISQITGNPDRETVLGICGGIQKIKVHTSPQVTLLQWQDAR